MAGRSVATKDSPTRTVEYVAEIARLYRDDYTGYCQDILGFSPYEWQSQLGRDLLTKKRNGIASGHGIGKLQCVDEPVLTPEGWRRIGDLRPGSLVATVDGSFTRVTRVFPQGVKPMYRVVLDDGTWTLAGDEHLWLTTTRSERKHGRAGQVRTTAEIAATLTFPNGPREGLNHRLPRLSAVRHAARELPVDPYVLGVYLGDGCSSDRSITLSAAKRDELARHVEFLSDGPSNGREHVRIVRIAGLMQQVEALGLGGCRSWEKFVPEAYMFGSIEQRLALLQGLLDTDGTVGKNGAVTFYTSSALLAAGVSQLVRSLGGVARRSGRQGRLNGEDKRWSYRVYVSLPAGLAPVTVGYKLDRYAPQEGHRNRERTLERFIASVERVEDREAVCIEVEHPSHLYVTRDHIVTHNTRCAASLIHWFISTRPRPAIVATANTEDQLQKKLWRELAVVNNGAKNRDWFTWKTSTFTMFEDPTAQAVALAWSENNSEAFAGTHETHVLGVFDEASAIPRVIFNVFAGAMSTAGARWVAFGNPTRAEGYFYDLCFGKLKARKPGDIAEGMWNSRSVASWESPAVDPAWVEEMRAQYGEESDEFRVRVAGLPPRFDSEQFIAREMVDRAMQREVEIFRRWPLVLGVDIGHSHDRSVIVPRRGKKVLDAIRVVKGERTMDFARRLAEEVQYYREYEGLTAQLVIENVGIGVGVVETLEDMGYSDQVWGINPGTTDGIDTELYANLRCMMWAEGKEWLEGEVDLPNHPELYDDLVTLKRKPSGSRNNLKLETKHEFRARTKRSPDVGDAWALTFAMPFDLLPDRKADRWRDDDDYRGGAVEGTWMGAM